ncbi:MAG: DUF4391 domain-containing protein [Bacteroidales bacterium]|nr:DUF4391 domain-containing protein [Bacteroidales bacterium]
MPSNTEVQKTITKTFFFEKAKANAATKQAFNKDIKKITITNVITTSTIPALLKGKTIESFYVVNIVVNSKEYDQKNIILINKTINQNIIYAILHEDMIQIAIYHTKLFVTDWMPIDNATIVLDGINMDVVWKNIVICIGGINVEKDNTLEQQINIDETRIKINNEIQILNNKMLKERQPAKKIALFEKIQKLKTNLNNI